MDRQPGIVARGEAEGERGPALRRRPRGLTMLSVAGEKRHGCVSSRVGQPEAPSTEALALQSGKTLLLDPRKLQLSRAGP